MSSFPKNSQSDDELLCSRRKLVKGASATAVLAALAAALQPVKVSADEKEELIEQKASVDAELESIRQELNEVDSELANAYLQLAETELQIPQAQIALDEARLAADIARQEDEELAQRLAVAQAQEQDILAQIEAGQAQITAADSEVSKASMQAYVGGSVPTAASVLLGASNPQEAVDRSVNYRLTLQAQGQQLKDLRTSQATQVNTADRLSALRTEIDSLKRQSEAALAARLQAEQEATAAKNLLDDLFAAQKKQADNLESLKNQFRDSENRLAAQSSQLDSNIAAIIEQERQAELRRIEEERRRAEEERRRAEEERRRAEEARRLANQNNQIAPIAPVPPQPAPVINTGGSNFINPVNAPRSSPFGMRVHPIFGTLRMHNGLDYAAACGTPIMASAAGTVIATTWDPGAGNMVIVSHGLHNGQLLTTLYFHMTSFAVGRGTKVSQGQVIGYVGNTGNSTGCHLHFETRLDNTPVNPTGFVG